MTSDDHLHDALIAALRSPARSDELAGEDDAVAAMCAAYQPVPARAGTRPRRGVVLAVVTVASLGVGGLAAAGPGRLTAPFTSPFSWGSDRSETDDGSLPVGDDRSETADTGGLDTGVASGDSSATAGLPDPPGGPSTAGDRGTGTAPSTTVSLSTPTGDPGTCTDDGDQTAVGRSAQSTVPPGRERGDTTSAAAHARCGPSADPAARPTGEDDRDDIPGRGAGNDGTPGPPPSTPGQGQPPADPGQGRPPANPGPPPSTPGQGQPPADPGPPPSTPGQRQPPADPGQGRPPANPGPPAQPPGQGGGNEG